MGWFEFALAYVVFFLSHSLPVRPPLRPWLQARLGASGFTLAYSALYLGKEAKAVWGELSASLGWLIREDRAAVELASVALGQVREFVKAGEPVPASLMAASNTALGKLGATPADRAKVAMPADDDDEHDPWAQFQPEGRA